MNTVTKETPDRYAVVKVLPADLAAMIVNARTLGLKWFVKGDYDTSGHLKLYLFFDVAGMEAFLRGEYTS